MLLRNKAPSKDLLRPRPIQEALLGLALKGTRIQKGPTLATFYTRMIWFAWKRRASPVEAPFIETRGISKVIARNNAKKRGRVWTWRMAFQIRHLRPSQGQSRRQAGYYLRRGEGGTARTWTWQGSTASAGQSWRNGSRPKDPPMLDIPFMLW